MAWAMVAGAAISVVGGAIASKKGSSSGSTAAATQASDSQAKLAGIQGDIAQKQYDAYERIYQPLEQQYVDESRGVGSIANQNKAAQQAGADVASSFAGAREQLNETPGLNPNSDAYLRQANRTNLAEAASSAAAETGARQNVQDKGRAAESDAVSLGKGIPATASSMLASAGSGLGSAARMYEQQAQYAQGRADSAGGGFSKAVGGITGSQAFQNWMNKPSGTSGSGSVSGGYTAPGATITYNNPSAYVAPEVSQPVAGGTPNWFEYSGTGA